MITPYKRLLIARMPTRLGSGVTANVVYLGGSITNGTSASTGNSWRELTAAWLSATYPASTLTHQNSGVGGTPSWYALVRLQTDVLDYAPELVLLDFAVNDSTNAWDQPSAEALVRRLRTELPNCTLLAMYNLQVADHSSTTNVKASVRLWWLQLCEYYRIPYVDVATLVQEAVAAGTFTLDDYFSDNVHPNNFGHAEMHRWLRRMMTPRQVGDLTVYHRSLSEIGYLHASTPDYMSTPILRDGTDYDATSGTWSVVGTAMQSSSAGASLTFTDTFQSFGIDTAIGAGNGTVSWAVDGGAATNINLGALAQTYQPLYSGTRSSHTVVLVVVSGTVKLNRFLAV